MTQAQAKLTSNLLDIIDSCENGVPLPQLEGILRQTLGFHDTFMALNWLWRSQLIFIDGNHVAHRVRT